MAIQHHIWRVTTDYWLSSRECAALVAPIFRAIVQGSHLQKMDPLVPWLGLKRWARHGLTMMLSMSRKFSATASEKESPQAHESVQRSNWLEELPSKSKTRYNYMAGGILGIRKGREAWVIMQGRPYPGRRVPVTQNCPYLRNVWEAAMCINTTPNLIE